MSENNGIRPTRDLYLAAFLKLKGFNFEGTRSEDGRIVSFQFLDSIELRNAEESYWNRKAKVVPRDWLDRIRALRGYALDLLNK